MPRRRSKSLSRRRATRQPLTRFTIFSEGESTEPAYFQALKDLLGPTVVIKVHGCGSSPSDVAKDAIRFLDDNDLRGAAADEHQIWAVFDRDTHEDFDEAIALCTANGIHVAYSFPCFEVWLMLHVVERYDAPQTSKSVASDLRKHRPEYSPARGKRPDCAALVVKVELAEARAAAQLNERARDGVPFGNPSTTVFELTRAIRAAAKLSRV